MDMEKKKKREGDVMVGNKMEKRRVSDVVIAQRREYYATEK